MRRYLLPEDGNGVCEASFKVEENTGYVRITVYDKSGSTLQQTHISAMSFTDFEKIQNARHKNEIFIRIQI